MSQWGQPPQGQQGVWGSQPSAPPAPQQSAPPSQPAQPWGQPSATPAPYPQAQQSYPQTQPGPSPYGQQQPSHQQQPAPLPVVTTDTIAGRQVQSSLGEVIGVSVREREIGRKEDPQVAYPALLLRSRQQAIAKMVDNAREKGADAVVGLRFDSSEITQSLSEVVAYGTAVRLS